METIAQAKKNIWAIDFLFSVGKAPLACKGKAFMPTAGSGPASGRVGKPLAITRACLGTGGCEPVNLDAQ